MRSPGTLDSQMLKLQAQDMTCSKQHLKGGEDCKMGNSPASLIFTTSNSQKKKNHQVEMMVQLFCLVNLLLDLSQPLDSSILTVIKKCGSIKVVA